VPMGNSFKFDGLHSFSPVFKDVPVCCYFLAASALIGANAGRGGATAPSET